MAGLYVHIPFCKSRCIYCGFYSTTAENLQTAYTDALIKELALRQNYLSSPVRTIYLGGGTPSVLSNDNLRRLFCAITDFVGNDNEIEEITIECNPDDISDEKASLLAELGVNRVSMGVQTFSNERLRFLRRRHSSRQAVDAFHLLRKHGFRNISLDLMFGFPDQSIAQWIDDLQQIISLKPEHISAYSLMIEENTPLYNIMCKSEVKELPDDVSRTMYDILCKTLIEAGYEHYEISNFALEGYRSRHNSSYWQAVPYMGIGAAAHSFDGSTRQWNIADLQRYVDEIGQGRVPFEQELLDEVTRYNDLITTALRTCEGISIGYLKTNFSESIVNHFLNETRRHIEGRLLKIKQDWVSLTKEGLFVSDAVMTDLIKV